MSFTMGISSPCTLNRLSKDTRGPNFVHIWKKYKVIQKIIQSESKDNVNLKDSNQRSNKNCTKRKKTY